MLNLRLPLLALGLLPVFPEQTTAKPPYALGRAKLWLLEPLWPGLGGWQANITKRENSLPRCPSNLVFLASFRKEDSCDFSLGNLPSSTSLV